MKEMLTIVDDQLHPIQTMSREMAHKTGALHQVIHCWVIDPYQSEIQIYLQQRSKNKADFPGLYDLTSTGHIDAGETRVQAVCREVMEEIGLILNPTYLKYLGHVKEEIQIAEFFDREIAHVFVDPIQNPIFYPGEEVDSIVKLPISEFKKWLQSPNQQLTGVQYGSNQVINIPDNQMCIHPKKYLCWALKQIENLVTTIG